MKLTAISTPILGVLFLLPLASATRAGELEGSAVHTAIYGKTGDADVAVAKLREAGPAGLEALLQRKKEIEDEARRLGSTNMPPDFSDVLKRLNDAIDRVGGAKYCTSSRLYWYTDLEQAKAVAQHCGKPILSLRMLGNLTDEFSCANSRFFRTTLYSNEEISKTLRDRFVLHWRSVRPVPKVTIDFGDGRKLERTLTGNSIHYVLMPDGQVVDAIPGLYGPKAFLKHVTRDEALVRLLADASAERRSSMLVDFHRQQAQEVAAAWDADWQRATKLLSNLSAASQGQAKVAQQQAAAPPRAEAAAVRARGKADVELAIVGAVNLVKVAPEDLQDEKMWITIASLHSKEAKLDEASRRLMREQRPTAAAAGRLALTKRAVEDPMLRLVASFETSIALDTVKNEYQFHRQIHEWLAAGDYRPEVEALNERVYAELFLTPSSDPWLGLAPENVYTALPNGGVVSGK